MDEVRCPYCNGTSMLPRCRVHEIEAQRDEFAVRKELVERLWGELCDLVVLTKSKKATLETLSAAIKATYLSVGPFMTHDRIMGQ